MTVFFLVFIAEATSAPLHANKNYLIIGTAVGGTLVSLVPKRFIAIISAVGLALTLSCAVAVVACGLSLETWATDQSLTGREGPTIYHHQNLTKTWLMTSTCFQCIFIVLFSIL